MPCHPSILFFSPHFLLLYPPVLLLFCSHVNIFKCKLYLTLSTMLFTRFTSFISSFSYICFLLFFSPPFSLFSAVFTFPVFSLPHIFVHKSHRIILSGKINRPMELPSTSLKTFSSSLLFFAFVVPLVSGCVFFLPFLVVFVVVLHVALEFH